MRQKLGILLGLAILVLLLIGLNAATYVQREKTPDTELMPNRSTYNSGATGTQAFYSLLAETGRKVTRWQSPVDQLQTERRNPVSTFVVIGQPRRPYDETEVKQLLEWVKNGGRLVLIDRQPPEDLLGAVRDWRLRVETNDLEMIFGTDPADQKQMTTEMPAARPVLPSVLTRQVNAVQSSRFASTIEFSWDPNAGPDQSGPGFGAAPQRDPHLPPPPAPASDVGDGDDEGSSVITGDGYNDAAYHAPSVHLVGDQRNILVDVSHGAGSIVFLTDPYIVSNAGVALVDNAQLGINMVAPGGGLTAFDEYHQGYGSNQNRIIQYFAGTPVIAIFTQIALIAGLAFFSRSRRFARAVPEPEPDRLTKLEYVAAMAELQQRTKAFDLAIENIYGDFRRRVSQLFGVDVKLTGRRQLAVLIAERLKADAAEIEALLRKCEDVSHGEPTNRKESIHLTSRLRDIESKLGMTRTSARRAIR